MLAIKVETKGVHVDFDAFFRRLPLIDDAALSDSNTFYLNIPLLFVTPLFLLDLTRLVTTFAIL